MLTKTYKEELEQEMKNEEKSQKYLNNEGSTVISFEKFKFIRSQFEQCQKAADKLSGKVYKLEAQVEQS